MGGDHSKSRRHRFRDLIAAPEILVLPGAWDALSALLIEMEAAGAAGGHIEDQITPKRCGHYEGKEIVERREFIKKIEAACAVRRTAYYLQPQERYLRLD
jgi:2-methylisocitrate lyase-like PEP mutase family enzyme